VRERIPLARIPSLRRLPAFLHFLAALADDSPLVARKVFVIARGNAARKK
jgi:hypothetical protein